jgi:hypothetical protein
MADNSVLSTIKAGRQVEKLVFTEQLEYILILENSYLKALSNYEKVKKQKYIVSKAYNLAIFEKISSVCLENRYTLPKEDILSYIYLLKNIIADMFVETNIHDVFLEKSADFIYKKELM